MKALRQLCEIKRLRVIGRQQAIVEHLRDLVLLLAVIELQGMKRGWFQTAIKQHRRP